MKSKRLLILLLMALLVPWAAHAQTLTVYETETGTSSYIPVYGWNGDHYQKTEFIIPASELTAMNGKNITSMAFYISSSNPTKVWGPFQVFLKEVEATTLSAWMGTTGATTVYTGTLDGTSGTATMTFNGASYTYHGGNLLVGIYLTTTSGEWNSASFYGKEVTGASGNGDNDYSLENCSFTQRNFIPRTTFTYQTPPTCPKPTFTANNVTTNALTANLTWTAGGTETQWAVAHALTANAEPDDNIIDNAVNTLPTETAPYAVPNLALGDHYFWVRANCDATDQSNWAGPVQVHIGYCTPNPSSRDNKGITAVSFGTGNTTVNNSDATNGLPASSPYYADYTSMVGAATASLSAPIHIAYTTGYNYGTIIWVDWNGNMAFEDTELVFAGQSSSISQPSGTHEFDASFVIPATQATGDYRMRIAGADSYFDTYINGTSTTSPNPCFTSTYAVCHDYTLRVLEAPSCMPVTALTVDEPNVTATQIPISWTPGGTETSWNIRWRVYGTTGAYSTDTVTTPSYTIPGLTAATKYEFGVQAGCDDQDIWVNDSYTTNCPAFYNTPFTQDFNSLTAGIPVCWNNTEGTTTDASYRWNYNASGHNGACVKFNSLSNSSGNDNYLKTPVISLPTGQDIQLTFWYKNGSSNNQFYVYIATEDDDYATRTALTLNLKGKSDWTEHAPIDLSAYSGKKVILLFYGKSDWGSYNIFLDDVAVRPAPDCATPAGLAVASNSQTPEGATITWARGEGTSWIVEYKKSTETDYTAITPAVNDTTYTFLGLDANTTYNARVSVVCNTGTGVTYPTIPVDFTTKVECPAPTNMQTADLTDHSVTLSWTAGYNETAWTVKYKKSSSSWDTPADVTTVEVSGNPTTPLGDLESNTTYNVRISGCNEEHYLSNSFTTKNPCAAPTNFVVNSLTDITATLSWTPGYIETEWTVKYKPSTESSWDNALTATAQTTPTITLNELSPKTTYNVRIYNCENYLSGSFTTAFSVPFLEEFTTSSVPTGWNRYYGLLSEVMAGTTQLSSTTSGWSIKSNQPFGNYHAEVNIYGGSCKYWLVTPTIMNNTNNNSLMFELGRRQSTEGTCDDDMFVVLYTTNNGATWTELARWDNNATTPGYVYNEIPVGSTTDVYLALPEALKGTAVRFAFYGESTVSNGDYYLGINDVNVDLTPTCYRPGKPVASNMTNHSATLTWTAPEGQTAWQIAYRKGTTFNPNDPELDWSTVTVIDVTENPYTIEGTLEALSGYYAYVRAFCGGDDYSAWCKSAGTFMTKKAAPDPTNFQKKDVGPDYAELYWKAGGGDNETWELYYATESTAPTAETEALRTVTTLPTAENPYVLDGLENETTYYVWVRSSYPEPDGKSSWLALSGSSFKTLVNCPTPTNLTHANVTPYTATLNWKGYSESYNVRYREPAHVDAPFKQNFENSLGGWTFISMNEKNGIDGDGTYPAGIFGGAVAHSDSYGFRFSSYSTKQDTEEYDQYLFSPELTETGSLKFYAWRRQTSDSLYLGISTTTNVVDAFVWEKLTFDATQTWQEFTKELSSNVKYLAFHYYGNCAYYVYLDDITINAYNVPASEWMYENGVEALTKGIEGLEGSTPYEWQVKATCAVDPEDPNNVEYGWSDCDYFTTLDACTVPFALADTLVTHNSATLKWTGYQEDYNVRYRTAEDYNLILANEFEFTSYWWYNWTSVNKGSETNFYYYDYDYTTVGYEFAPDSTLTGSQYLISPKLDTVYGVTILSFLAAVGDSTEYIKIGFSSTTNDTASFAWTPEAALSTSGYREIAVPAGTKYFAFQYTSGTHGDYLILTDFFVITNYLAAGEWQYANNVTSPATITGLEDERWYEWQVQGNNTVCTGDTTAWSSSFYFETLPAPPTQTIALIKGSNWVSYNVEITLNDLKAALVAALPNDTITIKSKTQTHTYNPRTHRWSGSFNTLFNLANMNIISVTSDGEITLQGAPIDPAEHPITINAGSNYLAFPLNTSMTPTNAFAGFAKNGDKVKSKNNTILYNRNKWNNNIPTLEPGQGYIYVGAENEGDGRTFVYPSIPVRDVQETVQTPKMHIFPDASKAISKAMPMSKIDKSKRVSVSSMKVLDKKINNQK